ncbi:hypothetical protein ACVW0Y_002861 [Pseudomonas sp. TE3786]
MSRMATPLALLLLGLLVQGHAMAFSKTLYLFSEVNGIVLLDGKPVQGVEVDQEYHWHWKDEKARRVTTTDAQGRFHFPLITGKSLTAALPHEPVVEQRMRLYYQGKEYQGWYQSKHNYDDLGELNGRPLNLVCDLNDEPAPHPEIGSSGICVLQK